MGRELIGILDAAKGSANLVREYALDHYVHYGFLPSDVEVDGIILPYGNYWSILEDDN